MSESRLVPTTRPAATRALAVVGRALRRPDPLALLAYAAVTLALVAPVLAGRAALGPVAVLDRDPLYAPWSPERAPAYGDPTAIVLDYPRDLALAEGLRAGRLDHWNPLVGTGAPLWAEQGDPFFPLKLPFYLSPSRATYDLSLALRLLAAALGAYFLARARGLAPGAAFVAGLLFQLSGAMLAPLAFTAASPLVVLPWLLLGAHALAHGPTAGAIVGAALAVAVAGHGGHPTIVFLALVTFGLAALAHMTARGVARGPAAAAALAGRALLAALLGLALAAPRLLPLVELTGAAASYKDGPVGEAVWRASLALNRAAFDLALLAPAALERIREGEPLLWPWTYAPAIGVPALVLAIAGVLVGAFDAALIVTAVLGLALALAPAGLGWVHALPGLGYVLPGYAWTLVVLPATQAAAGVLGGAGGRRVRAAFAGALLVVAGGALYLLFLDDHAAPGLALPALVRDALADRALRLVVVAPAALAGVAAVAVIFARRAAVRRGAVVALAIVAGSEAFHLARRALPERPSTVLAAAPPPVVAELAESLATGAWRMHATHFFTGTPHTGMLFGLRDVRETSALPLARYVELLDLVTSRRLETLLTPRVPAAPLLDLLGVRWVVAPTGKPPEDPRLVPVAATERIVVYLNPAARPRARIAGPAVAVPDREAARAALAPLAGADGHADDRAWRDRVVLEPAADGTAAVGSPAATGSVWIVDERDPDRLVLRARLHRPGYVLVADAWTDGWQATVDGRPAPVHPANLLLRAVPAPAGEHEIVMTYEPRSWDLARALFAAGAAGCALLLALGRGRRCLRVSGGPRRLPRGRLMASAQSGCAEGWPKGRPGVESRSQRSEPRSDGR